MVNLNIQQSFINLSNVWSKTILAHFTCCSRIGLRLYRPSYLHSSYLRELVRFHIGNRLPLLSAAKCYVRTSITDCINISAWDEGLGEGCDPAGYDVVLLNIVGPQGECIGANKCGCSYTVCLQVSKDTISTSEAI